MNDRLRLLYEKVMKEAFPYNLLDNIKNIKDIKFEQNKSIKIDIGISKPKFINTKMYLVKLNGKNLWIVTYNKEAIFYTKEPKIENINVNKFDRQYYDYLQKLSIEKNRRQLK